MYFSPFRHLWPDRFFLPSAGSRTPPLAWPLPKSVTLSKLHNLSKPRGHCDSSPAPNKSLF